HFAARRLIGAERKRADVRAPRVGDDEIGALRTSALEAPLLERRRAQVPRRRNDPDRFHLLRAPSYKWQATTPAGSISRSAGARHSSVACGQRGWKWHPAGGASGDAGSPAARGRGPRSVSVTRGTAAIRL